MTMITPSYLGETIEYSSLHACRSTLEDPTLQQYYTDLLAQPTLPIYFVGELTDADREYLTKQRRQALTTLFNLGFDTGILVPPAVSEDQVVSVQSRLNDVNMFKMYPLMPGRDDDVISTLRDLYVQTFTPDRRSQLEAWLAQLGIDIQPCLTTAMTALSGGVSMDPNLLKFMAEFVTPS